MADTHSRIRCTAFGAHVAAPLTAAPVIFHSAYYNYRRVHSSLRVTPAMEAGNHSITFGRFAELLAV
jgi:hypothetical protein